MHSIYEDKARQSCCLPHLQAYVVMDDWIFYLTGVNSTRLFVARPSLVSLLAARFEKPKPFVVSRLGSNLTREKVVFLKKTSFQCSYTAIFNPCFFPGAQL